MRIKNIRLSDYKRFTELVIAEVPATAKLVVLVGPNGSGKSSVFDAFLLKARAVATNYKLDGNTEQYYEKILKAETTHEVANRVSIDFHELDDGKVNLQTAFQVRSAYRNEADFHIQELRADNQADKGPQLVRIIDVDASVSKNYRKVAWKGLDDLFYSGRTEQTFGKYRKESLGELQMAMCRLFSNPELSLQDFGGIKADSFRFAKGDVSDFHYKNLSGGEKAAFDILLDILVTRGEVKEAVFCIDEPELHVSTNLQGPLVAEILKLLPPSSQLWVATHSIGIVREAYRMKQDQPGEVAFLDFTGRDFDLSVTIKPSTPNRAFWNNIYKIALDDLAALVAPQRIVICEGSADNPADGFDADCYNQLFANESDTLFISRGSSSEVIQSQYLMTILGIIAEGIQVHRLVDRDDMNDDERNQQIDQGVCVLRRRELEEYLYDPEVLRTFLKSNDCDDTVVQEVLEKRNELVENQSGPSNIKDLSQRILHAIREITEIQYLGKGRKGFAKSFLVPALGNTQSVLEELREDVFGSR